MIRAQTASLQRPPLRLTCVCNTASTMRPGHLVHGVTRCNKQGSLGRTNLAWPPLTLLAGCAEGSQHTWHLSDIILGLDSEDMVLIDQVFDSRITRQNRSETVQHIVNFLDHGRQGDGTSAALCGLHCHGLHTVSAKPRIRELQTALRFLERDKHRGRRSKTNIERCCSRTLSIIVEIQWCVPTIALFLNAHQSCFLNGPPRLATAEPPLMTGPC